jgi:type VI protein secretion system component VasK
VLVLLHACLAALLVLALAYQWQVGQRRPVAILLVSGAMTAVMASGLLIVQYRGGLPNARFFGHVMHWLGWLSVLAWLHAMTRSRVRKDGAAGLPLLLTLAACAAGVLALVQERI